MVKRVVIRHKTDGLFVGHGMGLAFFTLMDCAGQPEIVSFAHEMEARGALVELRFPPEFIEDCTYHWVDSKKGGEYIDPETLREAGLGDYLGELESNYREMLEGSS